MNLRDHLIEIKNKLMYDFPKHYSTSNIHAYQRGIKYTIDALLKSGMIFKEQMLSKEETAKVIYDTVYQDKNPKQKMGARLECLDLAQAIITAREKK